MRFMVALFHRDNYDPSNEGPDMVRAIDELNDEMVAAGVRVFVGGMHHASTAKSLRGRSDGTVDISDGSYQVTDEHIGGFWVLDVKDLEEALEWGRKATFACRAPVEVRQFHF